MICLIINRPYQSKISQQVRNLVAIFFGSLFSYLRQPTTTFEETNCHNTYCNYCHWAMGVL